MTVHIYGVGLAYCSVCTDETDVAVIERSVNEQSPTGIDSPWRVSVEAFADGSANPHPCEQDGSRNHVLLSC